MFSFYFHSIPRKRTKMLQMCIKCYATKPNKNNKQTCFRVHIHILIESNSPRPNPYNTMIIILCVFVFVFSFFFFFFPFYFLLKHFHFNAVHIGKSFWMVNSIGYIIIDLDLLHIWCLFNFIQFIICSHNRCLV